MENSFTFKLSFRLLLAAVCLCSFTPATKAQSILTINYTYRQAPTDTAGTATKSIGFSIQVHQFSTLSTEDQNAFRNGTTISWTSGRQTVSKSLNKFIALFNADSVEDKLNTVGIVVFKHLTVLTAKSFIITASLGNGINAKYHLTLADNTPTNPVVASTSANIDQLYTPSLLIGPPQDSLDIIKKYQNVILLDASNMHYSIYRNHNTTKQRKALWYFGSGNTGKSNAVLIIGHLNTTMYTISASNTSVSYTSSIPSIFTSFAGLFSGSGGGAAAATAANGTNTQPDFINFLRLDTTLTTFLGYSNGDFVKAKQELMSNVAKYYSGDIINAYHAYLDRNIKDGSSKAVLDSENTNTYHLLVPPDSVINATERLYNTIKNTAFIYQYNVIQLQNADQLQFTVNIAPVTGTNAAITGQGFNNFISQNLNIPILGGVRFDFSTGFYYSSIKNQMYTLYTNPAPLSASLPVSIVKENNYNGGTAGIDGLLHVYYPFLESLTPDVCVGVGTSTALNYSFLAGGGFMYTVAGQNKISVSSGYNFSNIKTLSNSETMGTGSPIPQPSTVTSVSYANNFKHGWFFSVSYSFGLTKATQPSSSSTPASSTTNSPSSSTTGNNSPGTTGAVTPTHSKH